MMWRIYSNLDPHGLYKEIYQQFIDTNRYIKRAWQEKKNGQGRLITLLCTVLLHYEVLIIKQITHSVKWYQCNIRWCRRTNSNSIQIMEWDVNNKQSILSVCIYWGSRICIWLVLCLLWRLCGNSSTPKIYTQTNIGEYSPFMIRFNSQNRFTPGTGFSIRVQAIQSGKIIFFTAAQQWKYHQQF
jgi:hypothetical protein